MTTDQLKAAHEAKPFKPFSIHLADGSSVDVSHPEALFRTKGGRIAIVNTSGDQIEIIDLLLVTKLSFQNGAPAAKKRR
jgi:hypothetical protein